MSTCRWTQQDEDMGGQFATECGKLWMFTTDGIKENGAKFCPYCGGSITEGAASSGSTGADRAAKFLRLEAVKREGDAVVRRDRIAKGLEPDNTHLADADDRRAELFEKSQTN